MPKVAVNARHGSVRQRLPWRRCRYKNLLQVHASATLEGTAAGARPPVGAPLNQAPSDPSEQLEMELGLCALDRKYSPEHIKRFCLGNPKQMVYTCVRGAEVVTKCLLYSADLALDSFIRGESVQERASEFRDLLTDLGPAFIKAGQVLANRPDIVRADFMEELTKLQDDVPPFPNEEALDVVEYELGQPLHQVFSRISPEPVAAASLGQVYKTVFRENGEEVALKVQRPGVEPNIWRDLYLFRALGQLMNGYTVNNLGCNARLIVDEFGRKLLEELDFVQEARNIEDFRGNFKDDPNVKIPQAYTHLTTRKVLTMEWINGIRATDPEAIKASEVDVDEFIRIGVVSGLRQLLEFGLFHGDPHPGNIFAMRDGRIAYVDFGNVAQLSQANKQVLIDAVVHAINEDYEGMAGDFIRLGFLSPGTDVNPIIPALEQIWSDSRTRSLESFNFRTVTSMFNQLVYKYPIRIPERYSLVIRSLLTQEGICMTLRPDFKFLEVAYPYVAKRLLTDPDPSLRQRLFQVLFKKGEFQWARLEYLVGLAKESTSGSLDLTETVIDLLQLIFTDTGLRSDLIVAFTEDNRLHLDEAQRLIQSVQNDVRFDEVLRELIRRAPSLGRKAMLGWADSILSA